MNGEVNNRNFFSLKNTVILGLLAAGFMMLSFLLCIILPASLGPGTQRTVYITYGSGLRKITDELRNSGMIRNRLIFQIYVFSGGRQKAIKAGEYEFSTSENMIAVVSKVTKGEFKLHRAVIPEGSDIYDIAEILSNLKLVDKDKFLEDVKDRELLQSVGIDRDSAEGLLFPDTYNFVLGETDKKIISTMYERFMQKSPIQLEKDYNIDGYKIKGIRALTLASIIEKEAQRENERAVIASVFYNRLRSPEAYQRRLESCSTVRYALNKKTGHLTYKDLKAQSRYNTYIAIGLPPGPISNPGIRSMRAALDPAKTAYRYFVARDDGSHTFSETLEEHNKAKFINRRQQPQDNE